MKKIIIIFICIFSGIVIGVISMFFGFKQMDPKRVTSMLYNDNFDSGISVGTTTSNYDLITFALQIADSIKQRDYYSLSNFVHPEYGVVFVPYTTISLTSDKCFTSSEVSRFGSDNTKYVWGIMDGTGTPIEMTPSEYFDRFVFNKDYTNTVMIGVDTVIETGNSLENFSLIFPDGRFVDLHFPESETGAHDWCSLRLGFEEYNGVLMLSSIIHSESTV